MIDSNFFDEMTKKFMDALPPGIREFQQDLEKNIRALLQSTFSRLNLVTREEFDVQVNVLIKTRAKVEELEKQIAMLEEQIKQQVHKSKHPTKTTTNIKDGDKK